MTGLLYVLLCITVAVLLLIVLVLLAGGPEKRTTASKRFDVDVDQAVRVGASGQGVPYVASNHPKDCAGRCCWEDRLTEMHDAFDWGAYEYEMRKTK